MRRGEVARREVAPSKAGARRRERGIWLLFRRWKEANPPVSEEVGGLFVLALLKEEIAFEEGYSFHFSEEMEQEFFGEVAKDRQVGLGSAAVSLTPLRSRIS